MSRRNSIRTRTAGAAIAYLPRSCGPTAATERKPEVALVGVGSGSIGQLGLAWLHTKFCRLAGVVTSWLGKGRRWTQDYGFPEKSVGGYEPIARLAAYLDINTAVKA